MSGFDKGWLALREEADRQARSKELVDHFRVHIRNQPSPAIMDIGCGTGSTYRTLSPFLPTQTKWKLLDYERALLEEAERRIGQSDNVEFHRQDLNHLDPTLLDDVSIVTASALFDLCSAEFCNRFVERLKQRRIGLYAALNYDGVMTWSITHPLDAEVVKDFNLHQMTDKGFGPALGPKATGHLFQICASDDYDCTSASSPWQMGAEMAELQTVFLHGLKQPVLEVGRLASDDLEEWIGFRLSNLRVTGSICIVGHADFLALPRL